mgnify:CR=1 FL=1
MENITIAISEELAKQLQHYPEVRWEEIAKQAIIKYLKHLALMDQLTQESELTDLNAEEIGELIKQKAWEKLIQSRSL